MADHEGQQQRRDYNRGRGAPRRPRGHLRGRHAGQGQPRGQGHRQQHQRGRGQRQGQIEDNEGDGVNAVEPVAPPREPPRRRVYIGAAALDQMLQLQPEELILRITNRVSQLVKYLYLI